MAPQLHLNLESGATPNDSTSRPGRPRVDAPVLAPQLHLNIELGTAPSHEFLQSPLEFINSQTAFANEPQNLNYPSVVTGQSPFPTSYNVSQNIAEAVGGIVEFNVPPTPSLNMSPTESDPTSATTLSSFSVLTSGEAGPFGSLISPASPRVNNFDMTLWELSTSFCEQSIDNDMEPYSAFDHEFKENEHYPDAFLIPEFSKYPKSDVFVDTQSPLGNSFMQYGNHPGGLSTTLDGRVPPIMTSGPVYEQNENYSCPLLQEYSPVSPMGPPIDQNVAQVPSTERRWCDKCNWHPKGEKTKNYDSYSKKHAKTHETHIKFSCIYCYKTYTRRDNLHNHMNKKHHQGNTPKRQRETGDGIAADGCSRPQKRKQSSTF